jgi:hypothetical protein
MPIPSMPGQGVVVEELTHGVLSDSTMPLQQLQAFARSGRLNPKGNPLVDRLVADVISARQQGITLEELSLRSTPPETRATPPTMAAARAPVNNYRTPALEAYAPSAITEPTQDIAVPTRAPVERTRPPATREGATKKPYLPEHTYGSEALRRLILKYPRVGELLRVEVEATMLEE